LKRKKELLKKQQKKKKKLVKGKVVMGHKIHPKSVRIGYIKDWDSKWFNLKEMPDFIEEDFKSDFI
jgi:phage pi2 protein 07